MIRPRMVLMTSPQVRDEPAVGPAAVRNEIDPIPPGVARLTISIASSMELPSPSSGPSGEMTR